MLFRPVLSNIFIEDLPDSMECTLGMFAEGIASDKHYVWSSELIRVGVKVLGLGLLGLCSKGLVGKAKAKATTAKGTPKPRAKA